MSYWLNTLLNNIKVVSSDKGIQITGLRTNLFFKELKRVFGTTRFQIGMMSNITSTSFTISHFFLYDFYTIIKVLQEKGTRYYRRDLISKILTGIEDLPQIQKTLKVYPSRLDYSQLSAFKFTPLPHQSQFFEEYDQKTQQYGLNGYILAAVPGSGKAIKHGTLVQTPTGWTKIEDLKVGDLVIGADGKSTKVTGVYPQGEVDLYKVVFADDRTSTVCGEHLWKVHCPNRIRDEIDPWQVLNTLELREEIKKSSKKASIPLLIAPDIEDKAYILDPYLIGILLGDDELNGESIRFTNTDDHFHGIFDSMLPEDTTYSRNGQDWLIKGKDVNKCSLHDELKRLELLGKRSYEREIPEEYMSGSYKQRLAMINGLLDTDGGIDKEAGLVSFTSTSEKIALQFQSLVRSLGDLAYIGDSITHSESSEVKEVGQRSWTIFIGSKNPGQYFTLPSKKERVKTVDQYSETLKLRVEYIESAGRGEATCISVDNEDKLFVIQDYVVTHNTLTSLMLQKMRNKDIVFVFSPKNALQEVWQDTLAEVKDTTTWVYPNPVENKQYTHYIFNHENTRLAKEIVTDVLKKNPYARIGVIVDECHKFTEMSADQTLNLIDICQSTKSEDIIFMSGTPFKALGIELLPFLMATDPWFTPQDQIGFRKIFGVSTAIGRSILAARIGRLLYKVEKADVINNDVTNYTVKVKVKNSERFLLTSIKKDMEEFITDRHKYYKEAGPVFCRRYLRYIEDFARTDVGKRHSKLLTEYRIAVETVRNSRDLKIVKDEIKFTNYFEKTYIIPTLKGADKAEFRSVKSVYKYLVLKIQGEALGQVLGAARTECNLAIIENIDNGLIYSDKAEFDGQPWKLDDLFTMSKTKVVMFTDFVEVLKKADEVIKKAGYQPELVYGDTNKDLRNIIQSFEDNPDVNPLIATFKSLSTAVPLVMADSCVLLNVPFRDYIYQQTTARIDRLGQKVPIHIYQYQLDTGGVPNISTRSYDIMAWSKKMVEELLGVQTPDDPEGVEVEFLSSFTNEAPVKVGGLMSGWLKR